MKIANNSDGYGYMRLTHLLTLFWGLPITRRKINNNIKHDRNTDVSGHRYSYDPRALPVWLVYAALHAYVMYYNYMYVARYVGESFKRCFEESYCIAVIELVNRNLGPLAVLACIAFHGRRHKVAALAGTERTLAFIRLTDSDDGGGGGGGGGGVVRLSPAAKYCSAAVVVAYCGCLWMYTVVQPKLVMAMYTANAMTQTAVFNLTVFQYYVLERGYARVNRLLEAVDVRRGGGGGGGSAARSLARLADAHDELGRLVGHLNRGYALGQLVRWPYSMIRLVMVVFRVIEFADRPASLTVVVLIAEHVLEVLMFLLQLSCFCAVGARLAEQAERTLASLQKLKLSCGFNLDREIKKTIDSFWIRVNARKVNATIGGFIIINMDFMKSVCGIIATYFLILIQFKFQKNQSKPLHPTD